MNNIDGDLYITKYIGDEEDKKMFHSYMYQGVNLQRAFAEALIFYKDVIISKNGSGSSNKNSLITPF